MSALLQITLHGLSLAALYFLVASGLTLIFGLMRVITMAHGTSYLLGGYIGYTAARASGNWLVGLVVAAIAVGILGLVIHQVLIRKFQDDDMRVALITLGVSLIGTDVMLHTFGGTATQVPIDPELHTATVALPGVGAYSVLRLLVTALAVAVGIGLWLLIHRTRFGAVVRAGVDDAVMTAATGVNVRVVFATIFVLGSALAAVAGVVGGTLFPLMPGQDATFLLFSLVVVIVGGMGSITGAAIGALLVGVVSQFAIAYIPTYQLVLTFALMVAVLALRPQGLMGRIR